MKDPLWLIRAKALPAGGTTRVTCCATDRSMLVTNDKKGYRGYCFRCGDAPFVSHGLFSVADLERRKQELALLQDRYVTLPKDFTTDIPTSDAVWLYRAGVGHDLAKHYGFGYSALLRRVILPVYKSETLIGFTARSTINERPKYIEKMASPSEGIFLADRSLVLPSYMEQAMDGAPDLVITEDILSAVRVGRVVRRSVSLMGTSASASQLTEALLGTPDGGTVAVWLDPDRAGRVARLRIARTLSLLGYNVRQIKSTQDPKRYSYREIRSYLDD